MNTIYVTDRDYTRLAKLVKRLRLRESSAELTTLTEELRRAVKVPSEEIAPTVVTMNSKVVLEDLRTGREQQLTVVYPEDADMNEMKISILSPSAIALLGSKVGDRVEWPAPNGVANYVVTKIFFQPEAARRYDL
ncbi:MAG TPA: GreA/GreB family elongation factor [Candidatus Kapabacteria bacterium]|nr:GreA/GreB family elongation factor [Candidatus Kapabacteria bacterium]